MYVWQVFFFVCSDDGISKNDVGLPVSRMCHVDEDILEALHSLSLQRTGTGGEGHSYRFLGRRGELKL